MESTVTEDTGKKLTKKKKKKIIFLFWCRTDTAWEISLEFYYPENHLQI
jgi:hypothetical protein